MIRLTTQEEAADVPRAVASQLAYHPTYQKHWMYVVPFMHFITNFGDRSVQRMKMQAFLS